MPTVSDSIFQGYENSEESAEALIELADLFVAECGQWLDDIGVAIEDHDVDAVLLAAESLKCSLAVFSLDSAVEKTVVIEQLARDREWELLSISIEELSPMCGLARRAIQRTVLRSVADHRRCVNWSASRILLDATLDRSRCWLPAPRPCGLHHVRQSGVAAR